MSCKVEKIGTNKAKFTIEIDNAEFLKAEQKAFDKQKGRLSIPGFRKGKVTKEMAYKVYGKGAFLEDAVNECINATYYQEIKGSGEKVLSKPVIDVVQVDFEKPFIYTAEASIVPEITLGEYKGIELEKTKVEVKDADVDAALKAEQEKNARVVSVDRKSKNGDIVSIDFEGFIDGKPFKGGKAEKYQLELGSKSFIDNFEDQLVDKSINDEVDVNVKFPESYGEKNLAGKPALFKVKINEIKEKQMPELNDEFASEVSEFETIKDYREDIKKKIEETKKYDAEEKDKVRLLDIVVKNTKIDLTDESIDYELEGMMEDYANRLRYQGLEFEKYLSMMGKTVDDFKKDYRKDAERNLKNSIVLDALAKKENIEATDEMVEKEIERMAKSYGMDLEKFKKSYANDDDRKMMKEDLRYPAVFNYLYENAKLK